MLDIIVNESTIEISNSNTITGEIYFHYDGSYFPEEHWNDFVVIILVWWNKSVATLDNSSVGSSIDFDFMDGPFSVRATKKEIDIVSLRFMQRNRDHTTVTDELEIGIADLKRSTINATRKVLRVIQINNWQSDDILELRKELNQK